MKLILLSGGSGKRLWPLSNETRSKQFLPLLATPEGRRESMVQRVVRQVRESALTDDITVATNLSQRDILVNQLGEQISLVTEPERRHTFPAVCLAVNYLSKEKRCAPDETVLVMPCDPYVDSDYFEALRQMMAIVENRCADLVLMGVPAERPSTKFGYIVPSTEEASGHSGVSYRLHKVSRFKEKPSTEEAAQLMAQGALWNCGVFAFRLSYLQEWSERYVKADTYEGVRARFSEFPRLSFDDEVAAKASSAAVLVFPGKWQDLGTWSLLAEKFPESGLGNVVYGPNNVNTQVINELSMPIFVDGLNGAVVAASPDGILVSAKQTSESVKEYADKLISRPMYEERRWGVYRVIDSVTYDDGYRSLTKNLTVKAGKNISYQVHRHRDEVWTFVDGEGLLVLDGEVSRVGRGDVVHIRKGQFHAIRALTDLQFIEVQTGDQLVEEDIERFSWEW